MDKSEVARQSQSRQTRADAPSNRLALIHLHPQILKTIKLSTHTNKIPVLVITGSEDDDYKKKVSEYGISILLQKPCNASQVLSEAKKLLQL